MNDDPSLNWYTRRTLLYQNRVKNTLLYQNLPIHSVGPFFPVSLGENLRSRPLERHSPFNFLDVLREGNVLTSIGSGKRVVRGRFIIIIYYYYSS